MQFRRSSYSSLAVFALLCACSADTEVGAGNRPPTMDVPASLQGLEGQTLTFAIVASDPDDDALALTADTLPPGASFDTGTGTFIWATPYTAGRAEPYTVTFTANDQRQSVQKSAVITIADVNQTPTLLLPGPQTVDEGVEVTFTVAASDADTEDTVTVTMPSHPPGATFDGRTFRWIPGYDQAGSNSVSFSAQDNHVLSAPKNATGSVNISVGNVNRKPRFVNPPTTRIFRESETATFTMTADDPDGETVAVTLRDLNTPATTASVQPNGAFSWAIPAGTHGTYEFKFFVSDGSPQPYPEQVEAVQVKLTNLAPVLAAVADRSLNEGDTLAFVLEGAPADPAEADAASEDSQLLTYSMRSIGALDLPAAATIGARSGAFYWNVGCTAAGSYQMEFKVTDDGVPARTATRRASFTVIAGNCAPAFTLFTRLEDGSTQGVGRVPAFAVDEDSTVTLAVAALDEDDDVVTFGIVESSRPPGAAFNPATHVFTWRPSCTASAQSPYSVIFTAGDGLSAPAQQSVRINVANVNCAPRITSLCGLALSPTDQSVVSCPAAEAQSLTFTAAAQDGDSDALIWSASLPTKLAGAFNTATRGFAWRPGCSDAGAYNGTFTVSDGALSHTRNISFVVSPGVCRPEFTGLVLTQDGLVTNVAVADADTEKRITVFEASTVSVQLTAVSPESLAVSYTASSLPAGASLDAGTDGTATLSWQPGCKQAGDYLVNLVAIDANAGDQLRLAIHVNPTNCAPAFATVAAKSVAEGEALAIDLADFAGDPDGDALTDFTVLFQKSGAPIAAPATASLSRTTGLFTWTPATDESGSYALTFTVNDHAPLGPSGSHTNQTIVAVTVTDTNNPPTLTFSPPGGGADGNGYSVDEAQLLTLDVDGADPDGDSLTDYRVAWADAAGNGLVAPAGATLNRATGLFQWRPGYQHAGAFQLTFTINDHHTPGPRSASRTATITVADVDTVPTVTTGGGATRSVTEGSAMADVGVTGADADGDPLTLAVVWKAARCSDTGAGGTDLGLLPGAASFVQSGGAGSAAGTLRFTPGPNAAGNWCFSITAIDGTGSTTSSAPLSIDVTVANLDAGPTIAASPAAITVAEGAQSATVTAAAADADSDTVYVSLSWRNTACSTAGADDSNPFALPGTVSFSAGTPAAGVNRATFSWRPSYAAADTSPEYCLTFATTANGKGASVAVPVTVLPADTQPTVSASYVRTSGPEAIAVAALTVTAADADSDAITIGAAVAFADCASDASAGVTALPSGASFSPTTGAGIAAGSFAWTPSYQQAGYYCFIFTARRAAGGGLASLPARVTVQVTNVDTVPVATLIGSGGRTVAEGSSISISATGADQDSDLVTMVLGAQPPVIRHGSCTAYDAFPLLTDLDGPATFVTSSAAGVTSGAFTWTPGYGAAGAYCVVFTAMDNTGATQSTTVGPDLTVTNTNRAPTLTVLPLGAQTVAEGSTSTLGLQANDPDPQTVTLAATYKRETCGASTLTFQALDATRMSLSGALTGASTASGTFTFTTGHLDAGSWCLAFSASDGSLVNTQYVDYTVTAVDLAPTIALNPTARSVAEGSALGSVAASAADADSDLVTLSVKWRNTACAAGGADTSGLSGLPGAAAFAPTSAAGVAGGSFTWTPSYVAADISPDFCFTFTATANGKTATSTLSVTVLPTDTRPVMGTGYSRTSVLAPNAISPLTVTASDADSDPLGILAAVVYADCASDPSAGTSTLPSGVTWAPSNATGVAGGTLTWTPQCAQSGWYCFVFTAGRPAGGGQISLQARVAVQVTMPPLMDDAELCASVGKDCDSVAATDLCGASRTAICGTCDAPRTCGGDGTAGVCGTPFDRPRWPMPDSRTTFCTNGSAAGACPAAGQTAFGQDGNYIVHPASYTATTDTVSDGVTGLTWQRALSGGLRTWSGALAYCDGLVLDGQTDWRLPTRIELVSLVDMGGLSPAIDTTAFPATPSEAFWSASPTKGTPDYPWIVNFGYGLTAATAAGNSLQVRCVRPGSAPPNGAQYTLASLAVQDNKTGLSWQRASPSGTYAWLDALAYCEALSLDSHSDWRLPNYKELQSIIDDKAANPAVDPVAFPSTPAESFWSSSPSVPVPVRSWGVAFQSGYYSEVATSTMQRLRCVRGGVVGISFGSTGADQSFTVPSGVNSILAKLWGAGGGGGDSTVTYYGYGGGGGYSTGTIAVSPGQVLTIIVGSGGARNPNKGSGGGRSAIRTAAGVELMTAGGGGGAAGISYGGAGGGLNGQNGGPTFGPGSGVSGGGGTQTAGGTGGTNGGNPGSQYTGASVTGGVSDTAPSYGGGGVGSSNELNWTAGGGGGGWYGGGSGDHCGHCAGGGGSGYIGGAGVTAASTTAGSGQMPGNTTDPGYANGDAVGGAPQQSGAVGQPGGSGRVVIQW